MYEEELFGTSLTLNQFHCLRVVDPTTLVICITSSESWHVESKVQKAQNP